MIVCPRCGYPYMGQAYVISERQVVCSRCDWTGSSGELLNTTGENLVDPLAFDRFYTMLAKDITPIIGRTLLQLGLVQVSDDMEGTKYFAKILKKITNSVLETVIKEVLGGESEDKSTVPTEG
jgi:hypothetical protein